CRGGSPVGLHSLHTEADRRPCPEQQDPSGGVASAENPGDLGSGEAVDGEEERPTLVERQARQDNRDVVATFATENGDLGRVDVGSPPDEGPPPVRYTPAASGSAQLVSADPVEPRPDV